MSVRFARVNAVEVREVACVVEADKTRVEPERGSDAETLWLRGRFERARAVLKGAVCFPFTLSDVARPMPELC